MSVFDEAARAVDRATEWKPNESDPLRVGTVEKWKLIKPKLRPNEPVWLTEARDRDGELWSKFISEAALQSQLCGQRFDKMTPAEIESADPNTFPAKVGSVVAIRWYGKFPHADDPSKSVTRWGVKIIDPSEDETAVEPDDVEEDGDGIPF